MLFQCEDDRCELDIVIEQNLSAIRFLEPLLDAEGNSLFSPETMSKRIRQLKDIHKGSIMRIYGEVKGAVVLETLYHQPAQALKVVLRRLKQKDEEWRNARRELNQFWKDVYERNYYKSMEAQSSALRQAEKRLNNVKG